MEKNDNTMLSSILINLLKGVIYRDKSPELWQGIFNLRARIIDQAAILGLECVIDENEGYAYFRQKESADGETSIPRLMQRRQLSYTASLLCVLLRKKMAESDAGGEFSRVILTKEQIIEMARIYMPDTTNETKIINRIENTLSRLVDIGFVRIIDTQRDTYEVRRIMRAFVDADWMSSLDEKLQNYMEYINEQGDKE